MAEKTAQKEDILSVIASSIRIIAMPFMVYMILVYPKGLFLGLVFICIALTDMLDGGLRIIGKMQGRSVKMGKFLDVIADRIFFTAVIFAIMVRYDFIEKAPMYYSILLILSREIITIPNIILNLKKESGRIKETSQNTPLISKLTTFMQGATIAAFLLAMNFFHYLIWATCIIGILSGIKYYSMHKGIVNEKGEKK